MKEKKNKRYIQVAPLPDMPRKKNYKPDEQDKIARIYAKAEELHVKIGGKE